MIVHTQKEKGYSLLELLLVVSIISILAALLIPQLLIQRGRLIEAQAQRRLRTIGSVMADYTLSHAEEGYADFQELKDSNMISDHVTLSSIIVDYSLVFVTTDTIDETGHASYTIIAYPRPERSNGRLSTFAITEDNVVRVYKPGAGVSPNDPDTWEPII
jgi:prepilin-type N-terminal cleavage/methylation domain-containing protein